MTYFVKKIHLVAFLIFCCSPLSATEDVNVCGSHFLYKEKDVIWVRDILKGAGQEELRLVVRASTRRTGQIYPDERECLERLDFLSIRGNFKKRDIRQIATLSIKLFPWPHVIDILDTKRITLKDGMQVGRNLFQKVIQALGNFSVNKYFPVEINEPVDSRPGGAIRFITKKYPEFFTNGSLDPQVKLILDQAIVPGTNYDSIVDPTGNWDLKVDNGCGLSEPV